jgi:hypothetical protein
MWPPYNPEANELLDEALSRLKQEGGKRPDNFVRADLAEVVQSRYPRIAGLMGLKDEIKGFNRGIYAALSRDSHARLRTEIAALEFHEDGRVQVVPKKVDDVAKARTLLHCLETTLIEAVGAVSYLLDARQRAEAERRNATVADAIANLPSGFLPDLGLHLAKGGSESNAFHFTAIPVRKLGLLPDGSASWSANIRLGDEYYIGPFDVPADLRETLADTIGLERESLEPARRIVMHEFEAPPCVDVSCTIGDLQRNEKEAFRPFIVVRLVRA